MLFYATILTESPEQVLQLEIEMGAKLCIEYLERKREIDITRAIGGAKRESLTPVVDIEQLTILKRAFAPHQGATGVMLVTFFRSLLLNPTLMTNSPLGISHSCDTTSQ